MSYGSKVRWDLGLSNLKKEWQATLRNPAWRDDAIAGVSVALMAIPLSLAIALASGVPPALGLVSAIVGGIIAALAGGTTLAVTGPAAAMAVLVGTVVEQVGLTGLLVVTITAGLLQVAVGTLGWGRLARLVPLPVIEGFTAALGAIILIGQLPRALGLAPPPESHVVDVITHIGELLHETHPLSLAVALGSLAICLMAPRIHPRIPGPLLAVVVPTLCVIGFNVDIERIGQIPSSLPAPSLPNLDINLSLLVSPVLMVFALGSLETLLSSAAVDKLSRTTRHDPDQELIGQGLANMGAALFGGIPVTGVIARSALNVHAGAKTRRSALLHAVLVLVLVVVAARWLSLVPVAALAGVLIAVAVRMLDPHALLALYKTSRADAAVYVTTFVLMVALGLIEGVQWGLAAALFVAAVWSTRNRAHVVKPAESGIHRVTLEGSLTFLSAMRLETLREELGSASEHEAVVIDFTGVTHVDSTAAEMVTELTRTLIGRDVRVFLLGMNQEVKQRVLSYDHEQLLEARIADTEADLAKLMPTENSHKNRLSIGVASYRRTQLPRYASLFRQLATSQSPHTLFITCADSRVVPNLITAADPGELFILRNVGNMIPPFSRREVPATAAGVEYAVGVLRVSDIVVCGHSRCGAIHALRDPSSVPKDLPSLLSWLNEASARELCDHVPSGVSDDDVARMNALLQIEHLLTYRVVRERAERGELRLRAWFFDVGSGDIETYDFEGKRWEALAASEAKLTPLPEARPA